MSAIDTATNFGRIALVGIPRNLLVTINANGVAYATASGGLPIDLTAVLVQGAGGQGTLNPQDQAYINPADIVGFIPLGLSTNNFLPADLVVGTPTYTTAVGTGYGSAAGLPPAGSTQGFETDQTLATCPATIRLFGTGSANHAAMGEVADGANSDTFTGFLVIATGGVNN
jgi:hypothetical protein